MGELPGRTVIAKESSLDRYQGELVEILTQLLETFSCSPKALVKIFGYYHGGVLAKYRVSIPLPPEIGSCYLELYGEARSSTIDFEIAVLEAITTIRDIKSLELVGTVFTTIKFGDREERENRDHIAFVIKEPKLAAKYLDRYASLLDIFYSLHV